MRSQLIRPALAAVRRAGGDVAGLRRRFGLPASAESDPDAVLPLSELDAFFQAAAELAKQPSLGLHLARAAETGTFGVAEYACRTAPDAGEALRRATRYIALLNDVVQIELSRDSRDGALVLEQRVPGHPLALGRQANEFFVAFMTFSIGRLTGAPPSVRRVWIAHPDPTSREALLELTGARELRTGAGANGIALDEEVLDRELVSADPNLHRIISAQAERSLRERATVPAERARMRDAIRDHLDSGTPALTDIAERLGISARTLQRRLGAEGTSFQEQLDSVRAELATVYMADSALSLGEVAFLLGYADFSAFGRAFRRWTGKRPAEARRDAIGRS